MPTIPRRWPLEVEQEREELLSVASESIQMLTKAQERLDTARARVQQHHSLAMMLLVDTDRYTADALTRIERIKRLMAVTKAKPINGRWPMVVTRQREEIEESTETSVGMLSSAQQAIENARSKVSNNPSLGEAMIADGALWLARAITNMERMVRLLTEAGIGRE